MLSDKKISIHVIPLHNLSNDCAWLRPDEIPQVAEAVADYIKRNPRMTQCGIDVLTDLGPDAKPAIASIRSALQETLNDPVSLDHIRALGALWRITGDAEPIIPKLIQSLRFPKGESPTMTRGITAGLLGEIGSEAIAAIPDLRELSNAEDGFVRYKVAEALWRITGESERLVAELDRDIQTEWNQGPHAPHVYYYQLALAGEMGADAKPLIPHFLGSINHPYTSRRAKELALKNLRQIDPAALDQVDPAILKEYLPRIDWP
jgi:hypothetical protein